MHWKEVPDFFAKLQDRNATSALALQLTILTAKRTVEIRYMKPEEIDIDDNNWNIPSSRMKAARPHREPLSKQALQLIEVIESRMIVGIPYSFPSPASKSKCISENAMLYYLQKKKHMNRPEVTVHGFRSSFKDWCAENTEFPDELSEACLAHIVKDKTQAAYQRGDKLDRRRVLMQAWADYCYSKTGKEHNE